MQSRLLCIFGDQPLRQFFNWRRHFVRFELMNKIDEGDGGGTLKTESSCVVAKSEQRLREVPLMSQYSVHRPKKFPHLAMLPHR